MKLLFDANLSPKLAVRIADLFPGSTHIFSVGIPEGTGDAAIWEFAGDNEFVLVTGDSDFNKLEARLGHPPYVVLLQRLDYPTRVAAELLRQNAIRIRELENGNQGVLSLRIR